MTDIVTGLQTWMQLAEAFLEDPDPMWIGIAGMFISLWFAYKILDKEKD